MPLPGILEPFTRLSRACKQATVHMQAGMYHLIRATGHAEGWSVAFYFFTFIRGVLFFTVIVLIGTGWSYLKVGVSPIPATDSCLSLAKSASHGQFSSKAGRAPDGTGQSIDVFRFDVFIKCFYQLQE